MNPLPAPSRRADSRAGLEISARPFRGKVLGLSGLLVALASITVAGVLATAAAASADTLTVTVAPSTVAEGQTATVTASGQVSDEGPALDLLISPGSVGCAPDYGTEYNDLLTSGDTVDVPTGSSPSLSSGPFSIAFPVDTDAATASETTDAVSLPAGPYLLCGYLYTFDPSNQTYTTYATASAPFTLRNPNDSISRAVGVSRDRRFFRPSAGRLLHGARHDRRVTQRSRVPNATRR